MPEPSDERYKVVYDEAVAALSNQSTSLDELRTRVGVTLGATVIATAFFGSVTIKPTVALGNLEKAAIGLFVASSLLQVLLLIPYRGWRFRHAPVRLIADMVEAEQPISLRDMYREFEPSDGEEPRSQ